MPDPIVFDLRVDRAPGYEQYCPTFGEFVKAETRESKRKDWMEDGWKTETAAVIVTGILTVDDTNMSTDKVTPAAVPNVVSFVEAITRKDVPVVCEHFSVKSSMLLTTLFRYADAPEVSVDTAAVILAAARKLYDLRRAALDMVLPFLDGKLISDASHVHNPIRALRLDGLPHAGLCAFAGLPIKATRLTVQRKLAHRIGITSVG